jgi:hypothetical protein
MPNQTKQILERLKNTEAIIGTIVKENQKGRRKQFEVDYWNPYATNDEQMPEIVMSGKTFTIFYDELQDATLDENVLTIRDFEFILQP